jgi:hypothetical protein
LTDAEVTAVSDNGVETRLPERTAWALFVLLGWGRRRWWREPLELKFGPLCLAGSVHNQHQLPAQAELYVVTNFDIELFRRPTHEPTATAVYAVIVSFGVLLNLDDLARSPLRGLLSDGG